ncbi:MAG: serine/threonine protein kinase [Phycisphaerae bacterium]
MERFPEMEQLSDSAGRRVDAAADEAVCKGGLELLDAVLAAVSIFASETTLARRALLRTLLREHLEAVQRTGRRLPQIAELLDAFPDADEQTVVREVFAEQLPTLRIELGREIGRGGMGVIYECRQTAVGGRRVAVKMLDVGQANQAALWNRLREEVDILAQIPSPNVVQVFEVGLINGQLAVVMELAEQNLQERTGGLPQDQREAAQLVRKLAVAVQKAHDHPRKLIHQDLKPSNVLIMSDHEYKVADFGLFHSAKGNDTPAAARIVGTPGWLAPEQARGEPPTFATDVWGLGTVLYYFLTGAAPFPPKREQINAVLTEPLISAATRRKNAGGDALDSKLDAIVGKCLQKDPAKRYRRPIELAEDLQRYLNAEPIQAAANGRPPRSRLARLAIPTIIAVACIAAAVPLAQWALNGPPRVGEGPDWPGGKPPTTHGTGKVEPTAGVVPATQSAPTSSPASSSQPVETAESKSKSSKEADPPPANESTKHVGDETKPQASQPNIAKTPPKAAASVDREPHYFSRNFVKGPVDCEFEVPVDAHALALMPDDVRKIVEADPSAKLQESWDFESKPATRDQSKVTFTRTLKVLYSEDSKPSERMLDVRYGQCKTDVASQFFKGGKHHFITEASFGSLKDQTRTLSEGPDDARLAGKLQWKGATKNFYELTGQANNDLVIWSLIPKRE